MEPIRDTFNRLRRVQKRALIPFIMGGDPNLAVTAQLLLTLEDAGADLIEVGIPFSDPLADGPVIQAASTRALQQGVTPTRVLEVIASIRQRLTAPVVCLSYWNPIIQFGDHRATQSPKAFLRTAHTSGVSGVIVPDVPVEEGAILRREASREQMDAIFLAAPTSPPERLRAIARASQGFIYYVSVMGTTGVRRTLPTEWVQGIRQLKLITTKPVCVGFGISTPAQAARVARVAEGVIVGSALVRSIAQARGRSAVLRTAAAFVKRLRRVV